MPDTSLIAGPGGTLSAPGGTTPRAPPDRRESARSPASTRLGFPQSPRSRSGSFNLLKQTWRRSSAATRSSSDDAARLSASTDWAHMSPVLEPMLPGGVADVVVKPSGCGRHRRRRRRGAPAPRPRHGARPGHRELRAGDPPVRRPGHRHQPGQQDRQRRRRRDHRGSGRVVRHDGKGGQEDRPGARHPPVDGRIHHRRDSSPAGPAVPARSPTGPSGTAICTRCSSSRAPTTPPPCRCRSPTTPRWRTRSASAA